MSGGKLDQKQQGDETSALELSKPPFFIVGCVRSGTTILRDLLRKHPLLECPEETHFYRWSDPYASPRFKNFYAGGLFKKHRKLDNISNHDFGIMQHFCINRKQLMSAYGNQFIERNNIEASDIRLFDKTPQNVYGMLLISADFPDAKFVHIYRNPLNVVTSLIEGKVMPEHSLVAGVNYWTETMKILGEFKKLYPEKLLEIPYEKVMQDPNEYMKQIVSFVGEDRALLPDLKNLTHAEKNKYKKKLSLTEIEYVKTHCAPFMADYGY